MISRILLATLLLVLVPAALAAATPINLRIEGASRTIFEGQIDTTSQYVQSRSEPGVVRRCDGTNGGANPSPGATPTAAAYDALALSGQGFTGEWFPEYEDFLIDGFAGERNLNWGLLRNEVATSTGGCQVLLAAGDRVIWAAGGTATPIVLSALSSTAASPITVRATTPNGGAVAGAAIYSASAAGVAGPTLATTAADGSATIAYGAGVQRLKATKAGLLRSNRVTACVTACEAAPDLVVRQAPPNQLGSGRLKLGTVRALASGYARGRIAVRWQIVRQGVGLLRWSIESDDLSTPAKRYISRAKGTTQTSALVALSAGRTYALRFTAVDRTLNRSTEAAGRVVVPIDDRSRAVRRSGAWSKRKAPGAWRSTVLRGRSGAQLRAKLVRGRPVLLLRGRGGTERATLRVTAGRAARTVTVRAAKRGSHQFVRAPISRKRAGTVSVRVVRGTVDLDGIAAGP